jgi:hypothetical protein
MTGKTRGEALLHRVSKGRNRGAAQQRQGEGNYLHSVLPAHRNHLKR